jgi:hypothetical protein
MSDNKEMDFVGCRVICTLAQPASKDAAPQPSAALVPRTLEGTVYTVNPKSGILVLQTEVGSERSSFRMLRLAFIEDIALAPNPKGEKAGTPTVEQALPSAIGSYQTLPSLVSEIGEVLEKKMNGKKKVGEDSRKYTGVEEDISIRALEVLDQLARVYPDARWDDQRNCIAVGENVQIVGIPSWNKPKVKGPTEQVARIQKILETKK